MVAEGHYRARHGMNGARVGNLERMIRRRGAEPQVAFLKAEPAPARPGKSRTPNCRSSQPPEGQCAVCLTLREHKHGMVGRPKIAGAAVSQSLKRLCAAKTLPRVRQMLQEFSSQLQKGWGIAT
jgi:hypothetical protein